MTSIGRIRIRTALSRALDAATLPGALAVVDLLGDELDRYAELVCGPDGRPIGMMTRGEDEGFTQRAQAALTLLGLPEAAHQHHLGPARWFEHRRAFFKVEWNRGGGGVEPLAACYFRRRPAVEEVLERLAAAGVGEAPRTRVAEVAAALEKETIHFVAASFRPGRAPHHKLYFSQYVTPDTHAAVRRRIEAVFSLYGFGEPALREVLRPSLERAVRLAEPTLFLSVAFGAQALSPDFKLDLPDVPAARAAAWLPAEERGATMTAVDDACALAGTGSLTWLGVRFHPDRATPTLKLYCDVPLGETAAR